MCSRSEVGTSDGKQANKAVSSGSMIGKITVPINPNWLQDAVKHATRVRKYTYSKAVLLATNQHSFLHQSALGRDSNNYYYC